MAIVSRFLQETVLLLAGDVASSLEVIISVGSK